jgi:translation initiation factor 3 subunit D
VIISSYRKWNLGETAAGKPIVVVARTELDGAFPAPDGSKEPMKLTIKAFNEWDSALSGGVQWRTKLDQQKAAVLAAELKNNGSKLAKWTVQAILAGADYMKFGYVSRVSPRSAAQHEILGTQQFRPAEFANNINLSLDNCWGVLRVVCEFLLDQPAGKYLLLKDPSAPVVRIYSLPEGTFDDSSVCFWNSFFLFICFQEEDEQEQESGNDED